MPVMYQIGERLHGNKIIFVLTFTSQRKMQTRNKHENKMISERMSVVKP